MGNRGAFFVSDPENSESHPNLPRETGGGFFIVPINSTVDLYDKRKNIMEYHRAEEIMSAIESRLATLSAKGIKTLRGRSIPSDGSALPRVNVYQGSDLPVENGVNTLALIDRELAVRIDAYVDAAPAQLDAALNRIRREVYVAMMADQNMMLPFVQTVMWKGDGAPEVPDPEAHPSVGRVAMSFAVRYRHSHGNPSA